MGGNIRKFRARGLALFLLTAILTAMSMIVVTGQASARCRDIGDPVVSDFWLDGHKRAAEDPDPGTCNNNGSYQAVLSDEYTDGRRVFVYFAWTTNINNWYQAASTGTAVHFIYNNPNRVAYEQFCIDNPWRCGWGTNPSGHGTNRGF